MRTVKLGDVVDFYSGGTPSKANRSFWDGDVPWFSAKDMKKPRLSDSADHVSEQVFHSTSLRRIPAGTLAMVVRGMILAHTVPIAVIDVEAAINQDLKALIPRTEIDPTYLSAVLNAQHDSILAQVSTAAHGTKKLDSRILESLEIPLPPIGEQRRVAAILDQADTLRDKRGQILVHLGDLTQSIFRDMFGNVDHQHVSLAEVASVRSGITIGRRTSEPTSPVPYLAVSNVQAGYLRMNVVKEVAATAAERERYELHDGDLVLTEGGDPDKLGRGTVWRSELSGCLHQNHVFCVRIGEEGAVLPDYLAAYMASVPARSYFLRAAKQTTGIASINSSQLKALPVTVPPLAEQEAFVGRLRAVSRHIDRSRQALDGAGSLFDSLRSYAFRGEI